MPCSYSSPGICLQSWVFREPRESRCFLFGFFFVGFGLVLVLLFLFCFQADTFPDDYKIYSLGEVFGPLVEGPASRLWDIGRQDQPHSSFLPSQAHKGVVLLLAMPMYRMGGTMVWGATAALVLWCSGWVQVESGCWNWRAAMSPPDRMTGAAGQDKRHRISALMIWRNTVSPTAPGTDPHSHRQQVWVMQSWNFSTKALLVVLPLLPNHYPLP